jgi:Ca-activated chloride channel homolog
VHFDSPWILSLFLILPALYFYKSKRRGEGSIVFSSLSTLKSIPSLRSQITYKMPLILRLLVLSLIITALARPQLRHQRVQEKRRGIAIQMVVDRSGSMNAPMQYDGQHLTRLDVARGVFKEFVLGNEAELKGRASDLIGLITFARYADTLTPLTLAHDAVVSMLRTISLPSERSEDGTALGDALALAAARLRVAEEDLIRRGSSNADYQIESKVIILLTDGHSNAGRRSPMQAAKLAEEWGIKVYTIGIGDDPRQRSDVSFFERFFSQMDDGVDVETLQAIAEQTGGRFKMATDAASLRAIYEEIDQLERSEIESPRYLNVVEAFQPLALIALLLLLLEVFFSRVVFVRIP